jgi:hypothetical protein
MRVRFHYGRGVFKFKFHDGAVAFGLTDLPGSRLCPLCGHAAVPSRNGVLSFGQIELLYVHLLIQPELPVGFDHRRLWYACPGGDLALDRKPRLQVEPDID